MLRTYPYGDSQIHEQLESQHLDNLILLSSMGHIFVNYMQGIQQLKGKPTKMQLLYLNSHVSLTEQ